MQSREIIKEMLEERQELLVSFCRLTGLEPFSSDRASLQHLARFCQTLVDYAGIVHFEIFQKLTQTDAAEPPADHHRVRSLFDPLVDSTKMLVEFNDKYDASLPTFSVEALDDDLSQLGEQLAGRFELEDALIRLLEGDGGA